MRWVHYFAYGSNMLQQRLRARTPAAVALAVARLESRRLDFGKLGVDGSGKCDVPYGQPGECTWGVVYAVNRVELAMLDAIEGAPQHYARETVTVALDGGNEDVQTYVARRRAQHLVPFDWYHAVVLAGARQHSLPEAYLAWLATRPCRPDPDRRRTARREAEIALAACGDRYLSSTALEASR